MDSQGHVVRILEGVVGAFHGNEFDDVVFSKAAGFFNGNHFILCAVDNEHAVSKVEVFVFHDVKTFQGIEEGLIHLHFPFKAYGYFLAFAQFVFVIFRQVAHHGLIHADRRAAEGDFGERVPFFDEVTECQISAEAGRVVIYSFGFHHFFGVFRDQGKVGEAFIDGQLFSGVHAVAGPVKGNHGKSFVLGCEVFSEMQGACRFFAAAKAMGDDDYIVKSPCAFVTVIHNKAAPNAEAAAVDIKMLFHGIASSFIYWYMKNIT